VLARHGGEANHIHASAALTRCAHLLTGSSHAAQPTASSRGGDGGDGSDSDGGSGSSHDGSGSGNGGGGGDGGGGGRGMDGSGVDGAGAAAEQAGLCAFLLDLLQVVEAQVPRFEARQTANSLWALAKLQPHIVACSGGGPARRRQQQQQQEEEVEEDPGGEKQQRQRQQQQAHPPAGSGTEAAAQRVAAQLTAAAAGAWPAFAPQELATALYALAKLGTPPLAAGLPAAAAAAGPAAGALKPREVVQLLSGAHGLGMALPGDARTRLLQRALDAAGACSPRDCAELLHVLGLATERDRAAQPGQSWLNAFAAATLPALRSASGGDVAMSLRALGRLRRQPPRAWLAEALRAAAAQRRAMTSAEVCMCVVGAAGMPRLRPPEQWVAAMAGEALGRWQQAAGGGAARRHLREQLMLLLALGRLQYRPPPARLQWLVEAVAAACDADEGLPVPAPAAAAAARAARLDASRATSTLVWAIARLRYLPPRRVLSPLLRAALAKVPRASPQAAALTLYAAALLLAPTAASGAAAPGLLQAWVRALEGAEARLGELGPQGLTMVAWAAAQLRLARPRRSRRSGSGGDNDGGSSSSGGSSSGNGGGDTASGGDGDASQGALEADLQRAFLRVLGASRPQLGATTSQGVAVQLWAAARMGCSLPPGWAEAAVARQAQYAGRTRPQAVALTLWALATLAKEQEPQPQPPPPQQQQQEQQQQQQEQQQQQHQQQQQQQQQQPEAGQPWASAAVHADLSRLLAPTAERLGEWGPQDLAMAAWALARLGLAPPEGWLPRFYGATSRRLPDFTSQQLANLAWGVRRLRAPAAPPLPWVALLRDEAARRRAAAGSGGAAWTARDRRSVRHAVSVWVAAAAGSAGPPAGSGGEPR
jgi:hypothetical protein